MGRRIVDFWVSGYELPKLMFAELVWVFFFWKEFVNAQNLVFIVLFNAFALTLFAKRINQVFVVFLHRFGFEYNRGKLWNSYFVSQLWQVFLKEKFSLLSQPVSIRVCLDFDCLVPQPTLELSNNLYRHFHFLSILALICRFVNLWRQYANAFLLFQTVRNF